MFTEQTIYDLARIRMEIDYTVDLSKKELKDIDLMYETNMERPGNRTKNQVFLDTLRGYLCELAVTRSVKNCIDSAPITEGAKGISYAKRKSDKIIEGLKVEIKSWSKEYIHAMPLSNGTQGQFKSINQAIPFNDYFLAMSWDQISKTCYRIESHYLIDAKSMSKCFRQINWKYSKYGIDKSKITDYNGIDFREDLVGWYPSNVN